MKTVLLIAVLSTYGAFVTGCQSSSDDAQHQKVQERTVTDPNGNVISHTEQKSSSDSNTNPNP
jgi:hypothetical protein